MPDEQTLAQMYGPEYGTSFPVDPALDDPREPHRVTEWLKKMEAGTFIDYGCGGGLLLMEAKRLNWQAIGVEYDEEAAQAVEKRTGAKVISHWLQLRNGPFADILHLGDIIEHLTDVDRQMPEILGLLKPGGVLLAQGPLEANPTLFTLILRFARLLRRSHRTEMAPYHVLLATAKGQRLLFQRFRLEEIEFSVHEVSWPAPSRLSFSNLVRPRSLGLFILRRLSQLISAFRPSRWGNRYFYVGRWNG